MRVLLITWVSAIFFACSNNNSDEVQRLNKVIDSLKQKDNGLTNPQSIERNSRPVSLESESTCVFCVINYQYTVKVGGGVREVDMPVFEGNEFQRYEKKYVPIPIRDSIIYERVTSGIITIPNTEEAKYHFRDDFENEWRQNQSPFGSRVVIITKRVYAFSNYPDASRAREGYTQ